MTHRPPALASFQGMKTSGKQDEAWIMNRLIKQLTDMGFPVTASCSACPLRGPRMASAPPTLCNRKG